MCLDFEYLGLKNDDDKNSESEVEKGASDENEDVEENAGHCEDDFVGAEEGYGEDDHEEGGGSEHDGEHCGYDDDDYDCYGYDDNDEHCGNNDEDYGSDDY